MVGTTLFLCSPDGRRIPTTKCAGYPWRTQRRKPTLIPPKPQAESRRRAHQRKRRLQAKPQRRKKRRRRLPAKRTSLERRRYQYGRDEFGGEAAGQGGC